jgi:hypothetical protein
MRYVLPILITLAALAISGSAAFYSVSGLSKLFAGAAVPVIIMAASLEFSKLVTASLLYRYWTELNKLLKFYLTTAVLILILITSLGIYGFLTAAYQTTANTLAGTEIQNRLYESRRETLDLQIVDLQQERSELLKSVSELRSGLSSNVISYTDAKGNLVTTTSSATRVALERQLDNSSNRLVDLNQRLDSYYEERSQLETEYSEQLADQVVGGELGPLQFISNLTQYSLGSIVNFLVLTIVFVFDPLAIALVIAANFAWKRLEPVKTDSDKELDSTLEAAMDMLSAELPTFEETKEPEIALQQTVLDPQPEVVEPEPSITQYPNRNAPAPLPKKLRPDSIRYL